MIDLQYATATYGSHQETIRLMEMGDNFRYGIHCPKDVQKAFSLYDEVEGVLNSFEGRCAGLSPYIHMRMCECYLYGIGTDKNLLKAFTSLVKFAHYLRNLPIVAKIYDVAVDTNFQAFEIAAEELLTIINNYFQEYGFLIRLDNNSLRVFSKFRIPFQINKNKHPEHMLLKTVIQQSLIYFPTLWFGTVLHGRYGTTDTKKSFYDAENILFYNLDLASAEATKKCRNICFSTISPDEIIAQQRAYNVPEELCHFYEYFADPAAHEQNQREELVAQWKKLPFSPLKSNSSVLDHWIAMRGISDQIEPLGSVDTNGGEQFSVYLEIETPQDRYVKILSVLKPLMDAIVSALHGGDFSENQLRFFAEKLSVPDNWIINNTNNILGKRQYIQRYPSKSGIKWNPADDLCSKVSIITTEGEGWKLCGRIYKIENQ